MFIISLILDLIHMLNSQYSLKHVGKLDYFLGMEVKYFLNGKMLLTHSKYIRDLLRRVKI